jgi:hypothetical protein
MRFAADHAPAAPPRSFWLQVGLFLLLLALPVAIINLAVDPFDFRLLPHLNLPRQDAVRKDDVILWTTGELRRIPPSALRAVTVVICGDSRAELLAGGHGFPRIFTLGRDHILNLSAGGASFDETMTILNTLLDRLPHLRALVLAVPIERIGVEEENRAPNAFKLASSPLLYALNLGILEKSFETLAHSPNKGAPETSRPEVDPDQLTDVTSSRLDIPSEISRAEASAIAPLDARERRVMQKWKKKIASADARLIETRLHDVIAPLAEKLSERRVKIVFFFPPLHPDVFPAFTPKIADLKRRYIASLAKFGTLEDFSTSAIDGIPHRFMDASHVVPDAAQAIFGKIYRRDLQPSTTAN